MKRIFVIALAAFMAFPFGTEAKPKKDACNELKVISYNIRNGEAKDGTNSWIYRYAASSAMINDQKPDIFGVQEAYDYQVKYLEEYCKDYKSVGVGRENGKHEGEHMSIFYNKKTISLIKWGTFWLSETPGKPSMGWDAACSRTATWALMKDKRSGKKFYYVNTHLDHVGKVAQREGLKLIVDRISSINPEGYPMILTGDFNVTPDDGILVDLDNCMKSARIYAEKTDNKGTFTDWGKCSSVIDYIYYSGFSKCRQFRTVTDSYNGRKFISDHYPVSAILVF